MKHEVTLRRRHTAIFGVVCRERFYPTCICGWVGDQTAVMDQAWRNAERHSGVQLVMHQDGWREL